MYVMYVMCVRAVVTSSRRNERQQQEGSPGRKANPQAHKPESREKRLRDGGGEERGQEGDARRTTTHKRKKKKKKHTHQYVPITTPFQAIELPTIFNIIRVRIVC